MKGVIYARYSSDNQREESIEGQLRECKEYAERNGITILKTYIDRALSAKTDHRPDFQQMIKDSGKGLFDVVIVWKLDRFARNRYDSAHYKSILRKNGVKVVSAKEAIAEDSTGILLESLLEGYAEFYSAELSEKVIRGLTDNALKTKYNGGGVPIGYIIDKEQHFQLDPVTAPLVLEAFTLYDKGATMKELVDYLFEKGLCDRNNRPLKIDVVARLLKNRRYIGEYRYRDIVQDGAIPAIVPADLFDRVQERMVKNKKAPARKKAKAEEYLLTTKLFCGYCSAPMVGESGTSRTNTVHRYYKCVTAKKKKGCHKKTVKKEWIEDLVLTETMNMVFNDSMMEALADNLVAFQRRENTSLPLLKRQLTETAQGIDNLLNAIQQGILTPSTKTRLEELEETKAQLEISILQAEMEKPPISREQFLFWLHRFRGIDISQPDQRQRLIDSFVNAIYLYDDKIVLTFNYQDGTKTITLEQVSGSDLGAGTAPKGETRNACLSFWLFWRERRENNMKAFTIGKNDAGQRLDRWLGKTLPLLPAPLAQKYIRLKRVKVNGKGSQRDYRLVLGDLLELYINDEFFDRPREDNAFLSVFKPILDIVYEDDQLIICNKRPGLLCHPDAQEYVNTLITHIQAYLYQKKEWNPRAENSFTPALCHRIDRNTGGLVIAAKTAEALRIMNQKIKDREIEKYYLCVVCGTLSPKSGLLEDYLWKDEDKKQVFLRDRPIPGGKTAQTEYRTLAVKNDLSLVECHLLTGRTHQIRAQMAHAGHPLLGDGKYGNGHFNRRYGRTFQALWAYRLEFAFTTDAGVLEYLNGRSWSVDAIDFVDDYFPGEKSRISC